MKLRLRKNTGWLAGLRGVRGYLARLLITMLLGMVVVILIGSAMALHFEQQTHSEHITMRTYQDALWWSVVTVATVGYGDVVPHSPGGRAIGVLLILMGFVIAPVITGLIASKMVEDRMKGARGLKPLTCKDHILVCGWYEIGQTVLKALSQRKFSQPVALVADVNPEVFADLQAKFPELELLFIRGDFSQRETLIRSNLREAQHVLVLPDQNLPKKAADDRSVVVASAVRFLSKTVALTVQLLNEENRSHLEQLGVDNIVIFNEFGGYLLANNVVNRYYAGLTRKLMHDENHEILPRKIPHGFIGKAWAEFRDHLIHEEDLLPLGLVSEHQRLEVADIFSDDNSSIDSFIRAALERARSRMPEQRFALTLKPANDYIIQKDDQVLVLE
jgi:voltage-gated potassium channel